MIDPGFVPESIAYAKQELRDLDKFLPRPTIGQFCPCMDDRAQQIIDRDLQLRRHAYLVNSFMEQYRIENKALNKQVAEQADELEEIKRELKRRNATIRRLLHVPPSKTAEEKASDSSSAEKEKEKEKEDKPKRRGAPKGHRGATRPRPDGADVTQTIPCPNTCPKCGGDVLTNGETDEIFVEEIVPAVRYVIQQFLERGECTCCGEKVRHPSACGPPVRTGPNVAALLSAMRQTMGVTFGKLANFSTETLGISLTPPGVLGITGRMSDRARPIAEGLEYSLREKDWLNADETGWRVDGKRWQMWGFFDDRTAVYKAVPSRASQVIKDVLGKDFGGVVGADFYAAYDFLPRTQRCLVHLIRDIHNELELDPGNRYLKGLKNKCAEIISIAGKLSETEMPEKQREKLADKARKLLAKMLATKPPKRKVCQTLAKRIQKYKDSMLTFLEVPEMGCHNNRAERQLRPVVLFRKVSFGNRTDEGAERYSALATVVEPARLQGHSPVDYLRSIIAPEADLPALTRKLLDTS